MVSDPAAESGESRRTRKVGGRPRKRMANRLHAGVLALVLLSTAAAQAAEIKVAVSANFAAPLRKIGVEFEKEKDRLKEAAYEEKMRLHIPQKFAALKQKAMPDVVYTAPKEWQAISPGGPSILPTGGLTAPVPGK